MTTKQATEVLRKYQRWRMGGNGKMPDPKIISVALVTVIRYLTDLTNNVNFDEKKVTKKKIKNG